MEETKILAKQRAYACIAFFVHTLVGPLLFNPWEALLLISFFIYVGYIFWRQGREATLNGFRLCRLPYIIVAVIAGIGSHVILHDLKLGLIVLLSALVVYLTTQLFQSSN